MHTKNQNVLKLFVNIFKKSKHAFFKLSESIFLYRFCNRKNENVAIGGGFMEAVIHPDVPDFSRDHGILGLVFCGSEVRSNSVLIPYDVTGDTDIERLILQVRTR